MLTGGFSIQADNGSTYFKVEEYKRPTFEVTFDKIEKTYKFGEEVTLKGKAESFSGIQLQNAEVSYTITRQKVWWWRWGGGNAEHYVENKVSITVLTQDSEVPSVLLEGVLSEMHGMQVCFSEDKGRGYYAACFTSGNTTYLLESEEINRKQFTNAVEQFVKDQY